MQSSKAHGLVGTAQEIQGQWGRGSQVSAETHAESGDYCFCGQSIVG